MDNKLNSFMDHTWDGFYSGQIRITRFPTLVDAYRGSVYDIVYTGTPPKKQLFELYADGTDIGMVVRIAYPSAAAYQVKINNEYVPMNDWSDV
jgi:hypothetical protein